MTAPQSTVINGFASVTSTHAVLVNLVAVIALAGTGLALLAGVTLPRVPGGTCWAVVATG